MLKKRLIIVFFLGIYLIVSTNIAYAEQNKIKEYYIKTAFIYNFLRLMEWPESRFTNNNEALQICLIGNDYFAEALARLRDKKAKNRTLMIHNNVTFEALSSCHILFIDQSEKNNIATLLSRVKNMSILTISNVPGFAQQGGHIGLYFNNKNTHSLEINLNTVNASGLKISSYILTLATIVSDKVLSP